MRKARNLEKEKIVTKRNIKKEKKTKNTAVRSSWLKQKS